MEDYVKRMMLKRIILTLLERGECTWEDLKKYTGIPEKELDILFPMLQQFYEEIEKESGYVYRVVESAYTLVDIDDSFYSSLPGFEATSIFPKEIEVLLRGDPLHFITKTVGVIHKGDKELVALNFLIGLTPWMNTDTLHIYPVGRSGKGKSDLCATTLLAFPQHCYEMVTSSSPMSIFYAYGVGALQRNKIIFFDDIKFNPAFIDVVKAFSSATKVRPRHWTVDIHRRFMDIQPKFFYSIWLTSVSPLKDQQLKNRFLIVNVDESFKQDKRVWQYIDKTYRLALENKVIAADEFQMCRNMINILTQESNDVVIPFKITFPIIFDRRAYLFFIIIIKTIAFCYKFQRKRVGDKIVATRTDFEIAKAIYEKIKEFQTSKASLEAVQILRILGTTLEEGLSSTQIAEMLGNTTTNRVRKACSGLIAGGLVSSEKVANRWTYWKLNNPSVSMVTQELESSNATEADLQEAHLPLEILDYVNTINENEILKHFEGGEESAE